jgi:hypothetical protein
MISKETAERMRAAAFPQSGADTLRVPTFDEIVDANVAKRGSDNITLQEVRRASQFPSGAEPLGRSFGSMNSPPKRVWNCSASGRSAKTKDHEVGVVAAG